MVSDKSHIHNGMRLCHIHSKNIENKKPTQILKNTVRCISKTKSGSRCSKKTSNENQMCCIHQKTDNSHLKNEEIQFNSPCINYKLNKKTDCCYICLEETENKLSCGHFVHNECLLDSLQSSVKTEYKVFENKNKYFVITNCLYCKQYSILKNIPITDKFKLYNKKNKKFDDSNVADYFINLFLQYDKPENKKINEKIEKQFEEDIKSMIFDKFSTIIFDNYIQQKNISKITSRYKKLNKKLIFENIKNVSKITFAKELFKKYKCNIEKFLNLLETVNLKLLNKNNVQDEVINLINIF